MSFLLHFGREIKQIQFFNSNCSKAPSHLIDRDAQACFLRIFFKEYSQHLEMLGKEEKDIIGINLSRDLIFMQLKSNKPDKAALLH
jgi:hypothetical protein